MAKTIKYLALILLFAALGWKVYKNFSGSDAPSEEAPPPTLQVGDPESAIDNFYGTPVGVAEKGKVKTFFYATAEIDAVDGTVTDIRDQDQVRGLLSAGERRIEVDDASRIHETTP